MLLEIESSPTGIRVVVPARNAEWCIQACVSGLLAAGFTPDEVVVVDDGSTDATVALAQEAGVAVVSHPVSLGAAAARNRGARESDAEILFFVDADVVVHADARARLIDFFSTQPGIDAVFGAYDERPACRNPTSIYRNLLHHYVHCQAPERPRSFWTGCGAVRREAFERLGGFDERQRMMEDVEFGIRLTQSGGVVALYSRLRGKHLKSFSVLAMARSDLLDRAIPWTRLMLFGCGLTAELNLDRRHRLSAALTALLVVSLIAATGAPVLLALTAACAAAFVSVNRDFLFLVQRCAGRRVALAAVPLHALHYCCALAGFSWVFAAEYLPRRALAASARAESPPIEVPTPSQSA
jgi:hypothetical protein